MVQLTNVLSVAGRYLPRRSARKIEATASPAKKAMIRWPVFLIALPAAVATWSGWVGLGKMVGFGVVKPLPGILDSFTIDTSITLPIGVEAYAGYAIAAWLSDRRIAPGTRRFAKWSALGSLLLGMLGQVAYHLLVVAGFKVAPWQVVTAVSCLPVLVLGMGAGLHHMLSRDGRTVADEVQPETVPEPSASTDEQPADAGTKDDPAPVNVPEEPQVNPVPVPVAAVPVPDDLAQRAATEFFFELTRGEVPSIRDIKDRLSVGQDKAQATQAYLASVAA
ncbi:hypothetical protein ACWDA3_26185 [Nonomuraea rubra]